MNARLTARAGPGRRRRQRSVWRRQRPRGRLRPLARRVPAAANRSRPVSAVTSRRTQDGPSPRFRGWVAVFAGWWGAPLRNRTVDLLLSMRESDDVVTWRNATRPADLGTYWALSRPGQGSGIAPAPSPLSDPPCASRRNGLLHGCCRWAGSDTQGLGILVPPAWHAPHLRITARRA